MLLLSIFFILIILYLNIIINWTTNKITNLFFISVILIFSSKKFRHIKILAHKNILNIAKIFL